MTALPLDAAWTREHPLPVPEGNCDKNSRGRVLAVGGSLACPGALALTGEAALRAGAGKVQMATVAEAALGLGLAMPQAAVNALPTGRGGEIAGKAAATILIAAERADTLVVGPGMADPVPAGRLVAALLAAPRDGLSLVLDAAAVACLGDRAEAVRGHGGRVVLTPHHGEAAKLTGRAADAIAADPEGTALETAWRFGAVMVLKAGETIVATPDGLALRYAGGGPGLATGGSGDVLAGLVAGLLARGLAPADAACWGVWLHGEAGRRLAERDGTIGFLARELPPLVPGLMR